MFGPLASDGCNFPIVWLKSKKNVGKVSCEERLMILLVHWKSCGTHRSAVVGVEIALFSKSKQQKQPKGYVVLLTLTLASSHMLAQQNAGASALNPIAFA